MQVIQCAACGANNRPGAAYCMRCGKPVAASESPASQHAKAFVERERRGPFFGAFPESLNFTVASLAVMDTLITEMWGAQGEAPGAVDWQPPPSKLPVVVDLGAYLGEVLCRALSARWQMDPTKPGVVIAARVIDAAGRNINPFAQVGARFRDGAAYGMVSLYTALSGREIPKWSLPQQQSTLVPAASSPPAAAVAVAPKVDPEQRLREARQYAERGHLGNAAQALREVLAVRPGDRALQRELVQMLAGSGQHDAALAEIDAVRRDGEDASDWIDLRALVLFGAGRVDEAIGSLDMALMKRKDDARLRRRRAFLLLQADRAARAQVELAALLSLGEDAELNVGLAEAMLRQGQGDAARLRLRRVLEVPMPGRTATIEAAVRERLARLDAPVPSAPVPVPPAAGDAAALAYAAAIEHARAQRFEQALPLFQQAATARPERAAYQKDVGNCLHDLGRSQEAIVWFERALQLDPGLSAARRALAAASERIGQRDRAIALYRDVLARLDSDPSDVARALDRLKSLGTVPT